MGWPRVWQPYNVRHPELEGYKMTDEGAWELIASSLEANHPYTEIKLDNPAGEPAIVMEVRVRPEDPLVYIKVQIGRGNIAIGRSFHYTAPLKG